MCWSRLWNTSSGRKTGFPLTYRNNYYNNEDPQYEDSQEHLLTPRLDFWFNIRHGISLEYGFDRGNFERAPDVDGHLGRARYTYRFAPRPRFSGNTFLSHVILRIRGSTTMCKTHRSALLMPLVQPQKEVSRSAIFGKLRTRGETGWLVGEGRFEHPHPVYGLFHFSAGRLPGRLFYGLKFRVQPILWGVWVDQASSCPEIFGRTHRFGCSR